MQIRNMLILFKNNLFKKKIFIFWHNISVHILQVKCTIFLNQHIILIFNTLHDKTSTNKFWPLKGWFCSYCNSNRSSKYTKFFICESRLILPCTGVQQYWMQDDNVWRRESQDFTLKLILQSNGGTARFPRLLISYKDTIPGGCWATPNILLLNCFYAQVYWVLFSYQTSNP